MKTYIIDNTLHVEFTEAENYAVHAAAWIAPTSRDGADAQHGRDLLQELDRIHKERFARTGKATPILVKVETPQARLEAQRLNLPTMTFTATPLRLALPNEKPAPNSERVMVGNDVLLSVFGGLKHVVRMSGAVSGPLTSLAVSVTVAHARIFILDDVEIPLGLIFRLAGPFNQQKSVALPLVRKGDLKLVFARRATALGTIGADGCGFSFGLGGAAFASKGCGGGGDGGGDVGGHGIGWLVGALLPADAKTIPNRFGFARKTLNYFHGLKSGSFSPLNKRHGRKTRRVGPGIHWQHVKRLPATRKPKGKPLGFWKWRQCPASPRNPLFHKSFPTNERAT